MNDDSQAAGRFQLGRTTSPVLSCRADSHGMELDDLLDVMDRAAANLSKLEAAWARAEPFVPRGAIWEPTPPEYEDLARSWVDLLSGLPPIDGWKITAPLPDPAEVGRGFIDYMDIGEPPFSLYEDLEQPTRDLAEYRYRLTKARRRATSNRLQELTGIVDGILPKLLVDVDPLSRDTIGNPSTQIVRESVAEIERLLGDTTVRKGRWSDLHRHLAWNMGQDWHDIYLMDWPSVKEDIAAAMYADADPLPVPADIDLGDAASGHLTGAATTALAWGNLDAPGFERLLFDLLNLLPGFQNVQWLMHTNAADRGRDISAERVVPDGAGGVRTERIILQAKHWQSKSVNVADISTNLAQVALWTPPLVHSLVIASSGRFSTDGVQWIEQHNQSGQLPFIEPWPDSQLERLLSGHPALAPAHGLR